MASRGPDEHSSHCFSAWTMVIRVMTVWLMKTKRKKEAEEEKEYGGSGGSGSSSSDDVVGGDNYSLE